MTRLKRRWALLCVLLTLTLGRAWAQVATTAVQDTVYRADGTPAGGSVVVSWNAFTTAAGSSVPAGSTSIKIGPGGSLQANLAPNGGATPMGSYYTVVYHLDDGSASHEYWVIPVLPAGSAALKLSSIRNSVLPLSVAMQTVSKSYVDTAIANALSGDPQDAGSPYVLKAGDTMTGPLVLPGDPVSALQAADKNYVDTDVAAVSGGLDRKVDTLPTATQVVQQPSGTQLQVNDLNGELSATPYLSGGGDNGITNAVASGNCVNGCVIRIDPTYVGNDKPSAAALGIKALGIDERGGSFSLTAADPLNPLTGGAEIAENINVYRTRSAADVKAEQPGAFEIDTVGLEITNHGLSGGTNQLAAAIESIPYFKSSFSALTLQGIYNTQGQHAVNSMVTHCYGVGDCTIGSQYLYASGGQRDVADEGAHPFDLQIQEDPDVYMGTCAGGCTTGSTVLTMTPTNADGTQGDGRFLIDKNPAKTISTGVITAGVPASPFFKAEFSGTNFPTSVFLETAVAALSQPTNLAPGTVTLPILTSGVPSGFATNTAALPNASGVACLADGHGYGATGYENFETVAYTVVDGTHMTLTANKVHAPGAVLAVGGLCGYGLEQTVDTVGNIKQVFPVVGSTSATELYYTDARSGIIGLNSTTGGYLNVQLTAAAIARQNGTVTVTLAGNMPVDLNGLKLTVSGVADTSYNGVFAVTTTSATTLTYASAGPDSTSSGGTVSLLTGGFVLYPMVEVQSVMDPVTKGVNGYFQVDANTIAWAPGDAVEEPHYFQEDVSPDTMYITQETPHPIGVESGGIRYQGTVGPATEGWDIANYADPAIYLGNGGTHSLPSSAFVVEGPWQAMLSGQPGDSAAISLGCNSHGCNRWNSGYNLFQLQSSTSIDTLGFQPQSDTVEWTLHGVPYTFTPNSFTARTINVGTLNATTITGGLNAGAITSGVVPVAALPVFGPSGTTHSAGIVPDPGPTAGATRFLREDGTFAVPATGSTTGNGAAGTFTTLGVGLGAAQPTETITSGGAVEARGTATTNVANASILDYEANGGNGRMFAFGPNGSTFAGFQFLQVTSTGAVFYPMLVDKTSHAVGFGCGAAGTLGACAASVSAAGLFHETLMTPASSAAACATGDVTDDANFHYVCVAANTWKRVALSAF